MTSVEQGLAAPLDVQTNSATAIGRDLALVGPARQGRTPTTPWGIVLRVGADLLALGVALAVALPHDLPGASVGFVALCLVSFLLKDQYVPRNVPRLGRQLRDAVTVMATAAVAQALLAVAVVGRDAAAAPVLRFYAIGAATIVASRSGVAAINQWRRYARPDVRRTLIVGAGNVGQTAARRLAARPDLGMTPVGFLDRNPRDFAGELPVLGASWDLERIVEEQQIDAVVIGFSTAPHHVLLSIVRRCWDLGVEVLLVPRLFEVEGTRTTVERIGAMPLVRVERSPAMRPGLRVKYLVERIFAAALIVLLAPLMAALALAVLVTSGRPIFYSAPRVGGGGRPFQMLKFRTMRGTPTTRGEADAGWAYEIVESDIETLLAGPDPVELTAIGHALRRSSLDELPQLFNVVRGQMALIGPRPERVHYAQRFAAVVYRYTERHQVRPGITGWAQVHGLRGATSLHDRIEWDLFYVENWSPWLDVQILARTVGAIWRGARDL